MKLEFTQFSLWRPGERWRVADRDLGESLRTPAPSLAGRGWWLRLVSSTICKRAPDDSRSSQHDAGQDFAERVVQMAGRWVRSSRASYGTSSAILIQQT